MRYFCTVADNNFLARVKSLNHSLKKYNANYTLLVLCIDKDMNIDDDNIKTFYLDDLLSQNQQLRDAQNNIPSAEALRVAGNDQIKAKQIQFTWLLSPYFTDFCINLDFITENLLYIDSDIYFFNDWTEIYKSIPKDTSIGLVEHRMPWTGDSGKYNVGIIFFQKNATSIDCTKFWKNCLIDTNNKYYKEYGQCGDQKYLELFPILYDNVISMDKFIGHLAPWNLVYHQYTDNQIIWDNQYQNLMYYHFSNFTLSNNKDGFIPAPRHGINNVSSVPFLQRIHEEYYSVLKSYA